MKVINVSSAYQNAPVFQRKLRENEKSEYRNDTLQKSFDFLGIKELAMIMHGSCFPVTNTDFGVGSPFSKAAESVIGMEMLHGFNNNQLGPNGKISKANVSPYKSSVWQKNELFIDLNELKKDKYANILSDEMTDGLLDKLAIKYPNNGKNYAYSKYYDAFENYNKAISTAYTNLIKKTVQKDPNATKLNNEFAEYKTTNKNRLVKQGLFQVLRKTYGTGEFRKWENLLDRNLLSRLNNKEPEAIERYKYLSEKYKKDINVYCFEQFIADKQIEENKEFRKKHNFKYINDLLVGFSNSDEWINQEAFLPNWKMGCPNGGQYGPQLWNVPVLNPNKLFNDDGSLGIAGKVLSDKINTALEDCENVRIDHALGLIDPYIYDERTVEVVDNKLTNKFRGGNISHLGLDKEGHYKNIIEKIILPAMEKYGVKPENAVWEDLSNNDYTWFNEVYHDKHHLPGLTQLEFNRSEGKSRKNWALLGSHDSQPALKLLNENDWARNHNAWDAEYLAGFLHWDGKKRGAERDAFCQKISANNLERVKAKFAELFMNSEKIQVSFADFFGLDKVYNYGGKTVDSNWKLRLSKDFEDQYYKNLSSDNPTALNLPEILTTAVKAHMDRKYIEYLNKKKDEIKQYEGDHDKYMNLLQGVEKDADNYRTNLKSQMQPLLERLDKFTNILKEKE